MMHSLWQFWQRIRGRRTWTDETATAHLSEELSRFLRRLDRAGLPPGAAYGSLAANLIVTLYLTRQLSGGPTAAHAALQEVMAAVSDRIGQLTGVRPFEIQQPPEAPKP